MIKSFNLSELLRYAFGGSIFVAGFGGARYGISAMMSGSVPSISITGFITAAIVLGSLCYAVHRLLYYHVIIHALTHILDRKHPILQLPPALPHLDKEFKRDYARWIRRCNFPVFHQRLEMWAAHVHFLYCSAWAAFVGAVAGRMILTHGYGVRGFISFPFARATFYWTLLFSVGCLVAAFCQDYVLTYYDRRLIGMTDELAADIKTPEPTSQDQEKKN